METNKEPLTGEIILGLVAMSLAALVIANDFTAFSVALPAIEAEFATDITTVQWIINGYTLVFGVLIVTGGRLADMFGRRLIFFIGSAIFVGFSLLGGLATDMWMLLLARGLMGIGGALMWPAVLGMTYTLLPASRAALAGALIIGVAGFGNCIGPTLGGALTDLASWRWIFLLNLPVSALAVLVTWRVVARDRPDGARASIDYAGILALSIGLFALLLSLDQGVDVGWTHPRILGLFAVSAAGLAAFAVIERRTGNNALVPDNITGNRVFVAACLATLLMSAIFFAALLYLPQFMIKQLGYSAIRSGTGLLPVMGTFALVSFLSGPLYERLGAKTVVSAGSVCLAVGIWLLSRHGRDDGLHATGPRHGRAGHQYRTVLFIDHHGGDHRRGFLPGQPGRRHRVHVPGSGRLGRPWFQYGVGRHGDLADGGDSAGVPGDANLALCGLIVSVFYVGGRIRQGQWHTLVHRHRAHG